MQSSIVPLALPLAQIPLVLHRSANKTVADQHSPGPRTIAYSLERATHLPGVPVLSLLILPMTAAQRCGEHGAKITFRRQGAWC